MAPHIYSIVGKDICPTPKGSNIYGIVGKDMCHRPRRGPIFIAHHGVGYTTPMGSNPFSYDYLYTSDPFGIGDVDKTGIDRYNDTPPRIKYLPNIFGQRTVWIAPKGSNIYYIVGKDVCRTPKGSNIYISLPLF